MLSVDDDELENIHLAERARREEAVRLSKRKNKFEEAFEEQVEIPLGPQTVSLKDVADEGALAAKRLAAVRERLQRVKDAPPVVHTLDSCTWFRVVVVHQISSLFV